MSKKKLNIAIAGATGYVGLDLIYLLSKHPKVNLMYLCAQKSIGKKINLFDPRIKKKLPKISNLKMVKWSKIDILFLSLPNGEAQKIISNLYYKYQNIKFIDLSADFRLKNVDSYKKWYKLNHKAKNLQKKSLYSISEFSRNKIKNYKIVSNPGCYPTSILLPLVPLVQSKLLRKKNIIIDSKSGYSGAGKSFTKKYKKLKNIFDSTFAYSVNGHRHMAEIDEELNNYTKQKVEYVFNPHIIPTYRGILSTIYADLSNKSSLNKIVNCLKTFFKEHKFIIINSKPKKSYGTNEVLNTNKCEISICQGQKKNQIMIFSAIDNLVKGAAGQAIQNMNILNNWKETLGLK